MKYFSMIFLIVFTAGIGAWSLPVLQDYRPQGPGLISGEWAAALEEYYNERLPIRDIGINFWTAVQYGLLNEGRQGVVVGRDGWLFTDEEFKVHLDAEARLSQRLKEIDSINAYLRARNVTLVLALVPAKVRVYPQQLGGRRPDALYEPLYADTLKYAAERHVLVPDLLQAMQRHSGTQLFLKTDTHWTPEGAAIAAAEIAKVINRHGALPAAGAAHFKTELVSTREHRGDLLNYIPLGPFSGWLGPAPDELKIYVTHRAGQEATQASLFGDTGADIVLVGSSYSANNLWNFTGALQEALNREVVNFASEGEGPIIPLFEYLVSADFKDRPPRLLIWEFPERYLPVAYSYPNGKYTELMVGTVNQNSTARSTP
jgi:alginate O-acetyltransferase complex protein AlgJ